MALKGFGTGWGKVGQMGNKRKDSPSITSHLGGALTWQQGWQTSFGVWGR